ncbi:MAG: hypothetical protein ABGY95_06580 [Rubritalea sp.]|uniref:lactate/malate family dehydrogenase n=1 Tax=Rubritalea sp. TaxID=2109375 RepID=UPI003241EF4B
MKKVLVVGAGNVGAHIVQHAIASNLPAHFYLLDIKDSLTSAQILDLKDTLMFSKNTKINAISIDDPLIHEMDIVVITAGANQLPGESRLDLLAKNAAMIKTMVNQLQPLKPSSIILLVTNPVDIVTKLAQEYFDLPAAQVFGTGTLLDSARLRWRIAESLERNVHNTHGYVLGEHGDSEFVAWSTTSGQQYLGEEEREEIEQSVRKEAYEIIQGKGATYFGISAATVHVLNAILHDTQALIPVSACYPQFADEALRSTPLGIPCIVGEAGVIATPTAKITDEELTKLCDSAQQLRQSYLDLLKPSD